MDAGIPITEHVAGISVGLVSDVDPTTGSISEYRIVTDILVHGIVEKLSLMILNFILIFKQYSM